MFQSAVPPYVATINDDYHYEVWAVKQQTGEALSAYVKSARIDRAKTLLANTDYQVQEIAELVGMPKINTFGTVFKSVTGLSPTQYRARMLRETR